MYLHSKYFSYKNFDRFYLKDFLVFENIPHLPPKKKVKTVDFLTRMMYNIKAARGWGGSGTLHLQSAIAEPNAFSDETYGRPRAVRDVDSKVLCNALP